MREVPIEELLIDGHVLQGLDALTWSDREHTVDQEEWIQVGERVEDLSDVHLSGFRLGRRPRGDGWIEWRIEGRAACE